ncbi:MAG: hypothetical protein Q9164_003806 [Protoblastenia rupestris]
MPRPAMPPTPAASTDIASKDGAYPTLTEQSFNLPPPAIQSSRTSANTSNHRPIQPAMNPNYSLPPPPTRSRTIIQMTPKSQHSTEPSKPSSQPSTKSTNKRGRSGSNATAATKKQPSSTSAAGKKIARKTAHSVIERRRRSKMNEEFATLKGMIPACTGQEMHKLAILQASIDYLRYLEGCISDLKAANNALSTPLVQPQAPPLRAENAMLEEDDDDDNQDEDQENEDAKMEDAHPVTTKPTDSSHSNASIYTSPQSMTDSPAIDSQPRYQSSYASSVSTLPSPAFGPQASYRPQSQHSYSSIHSASTSPTLMPSKEQDEEATTALLMLNKDRRHSKEKGRRGLSVSDLLTH